MDDKIKTGYASVDRPHLKFYRNDPIREFNTNQTMYELVFKANKDNMEFNATEYFGNILTFEKLKQKVDELASAYKKIGVKKGDVVALAMINAPETAINLLALNKIGAVSKWLDVRASSKDLEHYLNEHDCRIVVSLDKIVPKINETINHTNVEKVLTVSPADSLSPVQRLVYKLKDKINGNNINIPDDRRFIPFEEFVRAYKEDVFIQPEKFDKERPSVIVQSSGTTGMPKSIVHSDYSFTNFVHKLSYSDLPFEPRKKLLVVVPPFVAYGLADSLFLSMAFGMQAVLVPTFEPDVVYKNLGKFNIAFAAPFHYRYLADNISKINEKDLKLIECLISGGDKITVEELKHLKALLGIEVINGYGNNEGLGAVTFNPYKANKFGTVGIPKYGDIVKVIDPDTKKELKYNEVGEICYRTETMFLEYSNNKEETNRIKQLHEDGHYWVHTGDLGKIDEDGYVSIEGRNVRIIVRLGFKISPSAIESVVAKHPAIKECIAVAVPDPIENNVPMLFYTLNSPYNINPQEIEEAIKKYCNENLKENLIPKYYQFLDKMPTNNNKYNFKELERIGKEYVENNMPKVLTLKK